MDFVFNEQKTKIECVVIFFFALQWMEWLYLIEWKNIKWKRKIYNQKDELTPPVAYGSALCFKSTLTTSSLEYIAAICKTLYWS